MPLFNWPPSSSRPILSSRRNFLAALSAAAVPFLFGACTAPQVLPIPGSSWESHTGQLLYRGPKERSVIGEVVVRHSGRDNFALNFLSGPGFPLLKLQVSGDDVVAEGALARGRWSGKVQNAPRSLQGWIGLREIFARLPEGVNTGGWSTQIRASGKRVEHIDSRFTPTGERFAFHFGS